LRAHWYLLRELVDKPFQKKLLHTVRGFGYQLKDDDAPQA